MDGARTGLKLTGLAGATALAAALSCAGVRAQTVPDAIPANPPELRDFRIDQPPTPSPAPAPPPVAEEPAPAPTPPAPEPVSTPAPVADEPATPAPVRTRRVPRADVPARVQPAARTPLPASEPDLPVADAPIVPPVPAPVATAEPAPVEAPAPNAPADDVGSSAILPISLALGLAALIGALLWRRRRSAVAPVYEDEPAEQVVDLPAETAAPSALDPVVAPVSVAQAPAHARPRLDIAFTPAAAGATDALASVDYGLVVINSGDAPASKVRMEARLLAMGQDHDAALVAFFGEPMARPTPIASAIPPGVEAGLRAQVTLPRDAVTAIQVRDRTVFVPLVAFNILYEWYDADGGLQHGQTAMSYVVGRENRPPSAKMAPFRLDQGPRIYREVGQRTHQIRQLA